MTKRFLTYSQRKRIIIWLSVLLIVLFAIGTGLFIAMLAGCTKTTVFSVPPPQTQGYVIIRPDGGTHTLPAVKYYFYNYDESAAYRVAESDQQGDFKDLLPVGHYRVLATNTFASGIIFQGMNSHRTAIAYDTTLRDSSPDDRAGRSGGTSATDDTPISRAAGAGLVYSLAIGDLEVFPGDTVYYNPTAVCLTRTVSVTFNLSGELAAHVTGITGSLPGVYPSIYLFTGLSPHIDVVRSPDIWMDFTTEPGPQQENTWRAELHLFGVCDPQNGEVYRNRLKLSLRMEGDDFPFEIDLTDHLSDVMDQTGGMLPSDLPLEIGLEWKEMEVKSNITPWIPDGDIEIPLPIGTRGEPARFHAGPEAGQPGSMRVAKR